MERIPGRIFEQCIRYINIYLSMLFDSKAIQRRMVRTEFSVYYKTSLLAVKDEAKAELSRGTGPAKKRDLCVLKRNSDARK